LAEFQLAALSICDIQTLPGLDKLVPCEETAKTFEENAIRKALYYGAYTEEYLFVDDSGLQVDALGGEPGVFSARYAGPQASDEENNRLLLERLASHDNRSARFVCVIAVSLRGALVSTFRGEVEGWIVPPRGSNGFGYDPMFYYPPFACTFGEASRERKQKVSHRGKALSAMLDFLKLRL
jgi:XTP/dITP diphosphohydrolase